MTIKQHTISRTDLIDFEYVFRRHVNRQFVRGKWIFDIIDHHISSHSRKSRFVVLLGEPGIGKTALLANYISRAKPNIAFYFFDYWKPDRSNPYRFARHLTFALERVCGMKPASSSKIAREESIELLREKVNEVGEHCSRHGRHQLIVIDGLDETAGIVVDGITVTDVLAGIDLPSSITVLLGTRNVSEVKLPVFQEPDFSNVITLAGSDQNNVADIVGYLNKSLSHRGISQSDLRRVMLRSEGNFEYARTIVNICLRGTDEAKAIIEGLPLGLSQLQFWRLSRMIRRVESDRIRSQVTEAIYFLCWAWGAFPPALVAEILEIDTIDTPLVFGYLEEFFDLATYAHGTGLCIWHHLSLRDFVEQSKFIQVKDKVRDIIFRKIIKFVAKKISVCRIDEIPETFIYNLGIYLEVTKEHRELLSAMRRHFLSTSPYTNATEHQIELILVLTHYSLSAAMRDGDPQNIVFFDMMDNALLLHFGYLIPDPRDSSYRQRFEGLTTEDAQLACRNIIQETIQCREVSAFSQIALGDVFAIVYEQFLELPLVYERCEQFASECCQTSSEERRPETSTVPVESYTLFLGRKCNLNASSKQVSNCRERAREFAVFLDDTLEKSLLIGGAPNIFMANEKGPFKTLKYLLRRVGQQVSYKDVYFEGWQGEQDKAYRISRRVYQCVRRMINRLAQVQMANDDPSNWLQIDKGRATISVNEKLNSCLILSNRR